MSNVWTPGAAGPHEDFVARLHRQIQRFAERHHVTEPVVTIALHGGQHVHVRSLSPDPGYGFITICPHAEEDVPGELVVPIGTIARIEFRAAEEEEPRFGFSIPDDA